MGLEAIYSMPGNVSVSFPAQVLKYSFHTNHFSYENIWKVNLTTKTRPIKENNYPYFKSWHRKLVNLTSRSTIKYFRIYKSTTFWQVYFGSIKQQLWSISILSLVCPLLLASNLKVQVDIKHHCN